MGEVSVPGVTQLKQVRRTPVLTEFTGMTGAGQPVEVALINPERLTRPEVATRIQRAAALQHPNLKQTLVAQPLHDGSWALVCESSRTLADALADGIRLMPEDGVLLTVGIAEALAVAHRAGLVHGGVGPQWVSIEKNGAGTAKLSGLPLAQLDSLGRSPWAAPEVLQGAAPTAASDVYSLGRLLLATLSGREQGAQLPDDADHLAPVVSRCLTTDPAGRYASAQEVVEALTRANATRVGRSTVTAPPQESGEVSGHFGPWEILSLLGEGSMGQVFKARHATLGRMAAIKLLRPEQYRRADLVQRFFQEARTVNHIRHEHIVEISDFGQEDGPNGPTAVYCVMELLEGESLGSRALAEPLSIKRMRHIVRQVCAALGAAHAVGVVHRDVKIDNIFLIERGGDRDYVKVLDFGVAKLMQPAGDEPLISTMDGAIIGTPTAMAPEQASGAAVDHRIDIYAVGVVLYQLLSGRVPFDAQNFAQLVVKLMTQAPPPLPPTTPAGEAIPEALAALVLRCLSKDPAQRPSSMQELRLLLDENPIQLQKLARGRTKRPVAVLAWAGLALALAGALVGLFVILFRASVPLKPVLLPPPVSTPLPAPIVQVESPPPPPPPPPTESPPLAVVPAPDLQPPQKALPAAKKSARPVALTPGLMQSVVKGGSGMVKECLSRHRALLPGTSGEVMTVWTIEPSGAISDVEVVDPSLKKTPLQACLVRAVKTLRFPRLTISTKKKLFAPFTYGRVD